MKKLSRRERILIIILSGIVGSYIYFQFLIHPQIIRLNKLKKNIESSNLKMNENERIIDSKEKIEKNFNELDEDIKLINEKFFLSIQQEYIIVLLNKMLNESDIIVTSINFSKIREEKINNDTVEVRTVDLPFEGTYPMLMRFLKNIREYEKKIIINELKIKNGKDGMLVGNIVLEFYKILNSKKEGVAKQILEKKNPSKSNNFSPFDRFTWKEDARIDETKSITNKTKNKTIYDHNDSVKYKIQSGDTIFSISRKFYNNHFERYLITEYNKIKNPDHIKTGQIIYIPKVK